VTRYQGTQLGVFWPIAHPLAMILIYTIVFSEIMRPRLPGHDSRFAYTIYLMAGLVTWNLFSDLLTRSVAVFVSNANLMKKVSVPQIAFPVIATASALLHFVILFAIFILFLLLTGNFPGIAILAVVPVLAVVVLFGGRVGRVARDSQCLLPRRRADTGIVLQFWFWLTPIIYPIDALPPVVRSLLGWKSGCQHHASDAGHLRESTIPGVEHASVSAGCRCHLGDVGSWCLQQIGARAGR
jgi:lipopolysaccharide transport system permease protein